MSIEKHEWVIYFHPFFSEIYSDIRQKVINLKDDLNENKISEDEFQKNYDVKIFKALVKIIYEIVPNNPGDKIFEQGKTLGDIGKGWRRVKGNGLPDRYRLFFRFNTERKIIIFTWMNGRENLRQKGARTDCYTVFQKMLESGKPPSDTSELLSEAKKFKNDEEEPV